MFKAMTQSLAIPHFGYSDEVVMDACSDLRRDLNQHIQRHPHRYPFSKISFMPIFIKSLSMALHEFPIMNACVTMDNPSDPNTAKLRYRSAHNIGVAMDTSAGLLVPNIKGCEHKSILDIAHELHRLQELGKKASFTPADLKDGTITLSNVGMIGGTYLSPVLVTSEVAIGAVGKMRRVPVWENDAFVPRDVITASWSADHRVIDGATMARFVQEWRTYVESPSLLAAALR
jgi:2-oxoisovalerate dehydrogenase E2 component (dihydrolipoyl transacylase)